MAAITAPFQEVVDSNNYYPGAESEKILGRLGTMLQQQHCFAVLTGEEGVGKTMLCMRLAMEENLYDTILFPETVESFGDVVGYIAYCLEQETEGRDIKEIITLVINELKKSERPLFIIFDQAENIYLATLERIRKLIHVLQASDCPVHVLFSGRTTFKENYEQLTAIDFNEKSADFFELGTISEEECAGYVYSVLEKNPAIGEQAHTIFTAETTSRIYHAAGGNFLEINRLAREALEYKEADSSFVETLVSTDQAIERRERLLHRSAGTVLGEWGEAIANFGQRLLNDKKNLGLLGGGLVAALFMVWFLSGPDEQNGVGKNTNVSGSQNTIGDKVSGENVDIRTQKNEVTPDDSGVVAQELQNDNSSSSAERRQGGGSNPQGRLSLSPLPNIGASNTTGHTTGNNVEEISIVDEKENLNPVIPAVIGEQKQNTAGIISIKSRPSKRQKSAVTERVETPAQIKAKAQKRPDQEENDAGSLSEEIPHLKREQYKKKRVNEEDGVSFVENTRMLGERDTFFSHEDAVLIRKELNKEKRDGLLKKSIHLQALQKKKILLSPMLQEGGDGNIVIDAANPKTSLEKLVQNRFVAGYRWKNKQQDHLYTIPLMAVSARIAGRRLSSLFTATKTRQLVPDIYLFRDNTTQGGIVIYYGEFASRRMGEEAARMISPLFDNAPFDVVQIRRAMQRVKK